MIVHVPLTSSAPPRQRPAVPAGLIARFFENVLPVMVTVDPGSEWIAPPSAGKTPTAWLFRKLLLVTVKVLPK